MAANESYTPQVPLIERPLPVPGVVGNLEDLKGQQDLYFKTLIGSYISFNSPAPSPEVEKATPWVSGLSLHYWHLTPDQPDTQHSHLQDELYLVLEGSGKIELGNERKMHPVKAGDVVFVPAYLFHRFHLATDEQLRMVVFFGPDFCGRNGAKAYGHDNDPVDAP